MGFVSFAGRVLFASVFLLSAYQEFNEFGVNGGPAAKAFRPKYNRFVDHVSTHLGVAVPHVEMKHIIAATIVLKGVGGLLFILSSSFGAYLLLLYMAFITPVVYDFYNYDMERPEFAQLFVKFNQNLALFGALLFFLGMKNSIPKRQSKKKDQQEFWCLQCKQELIGLHNMQEHNKERHVFDKHHCYDCKNKFKTAGEKRTHKCPT